MTSAAWSPAARGPRRASGSSPKPPICRRNSSRIVVTDDRGRYLVPDLPKATYDVWVRGYGLVDSPHVRTGVGRHAQPDRGGGAGCACRRSVLSGGLLVLAAARPGEARVPRDRRQRHRAGHEEPGRLAQKLEVGRVLGVSRAGDEGHARDPGRVRTMPSTDAWQRRILSGQAGANMMTGMTQLGMAAP